MNERVAGQAAYRRGEIHLLRGELDSAEAAYREASRLGREPQPGLAFLRLAQGEGEAASASLRRALGESTEPLQRAALLPAYIEIMLAVGDLEQARAGCRDLHDVAERQDSRALAAMADYAAAGSNWRIGMPAPRWARCVRRAGSGRSSERLARSHAHGCWWG